MIFVMVMWDVIFMDGIAGSFETPYQSAPLDMGSDSFPSSAAGKSANASTTSNAPAVSTSSPPSTTANVPTKLGLGCRWELFSKQDLLEVAECLGGHSISIVCQMLVEEWDHCSSGMPDLIIWRMEDKVVRFVEIKGPGDRLSETQKCGSMYC